LLRYGTFYAKWLLDEANFCRCLAIARSYTLNSKRKEALALFARASSHARNVSKTSSEADTGKPLSLEVTSKQAQKLQNSLKHLTTRYRALVELHNMHADAMKAAASRSAGAAPLVERLDEYPVEGVNLTNLVMYPPRLRPIPVKPIFLDVAWNYIQYPGEAKHEVTPKAQSRATDSQSVVEEKKPQKKGWFGFGR
jgi:signal recognition particle subunit SRP68